MSEDTARVGPPEQQPDDASAAPFVPTHTVPDGGMPTWEAPDPAVEPGSRLDPGLPVRVDEQRPDGWAHIVCSNGWEAWVDGRLLTPVTALAWGERSVEGGPDEELRVRLQQALAAYRDILDDLKHEREDLPALRRRAVRAGLVVCEDEAWVIDVANGRLYRYDGLRLVSVDLSTITSAAAEG